MAVDLKQCPCWVHSWIMEPWTWPESFGCFLLRAFKIDFCAYIDDVAYVSNVSGVEKPPLDQVYQYPSFGITHLKNHLPSLNLTASLHLKIDGWETTFLLGNVYFQGRTASLGSIHPWRSNIAPRSLTNITIAYDKWMGSKKERRTSFFHHFSGASY